MSDPVPVDHFATLSLIDCEDSGLRELLNALNSVRTCTLDEVNTVAEHMNDVLSVIRRDPIFGVRPTQAVQTPQAVQTSQAAQTSQVTQTPLAAQTPQAAQTSQPPLSPQPAQPARGPQLPYVEIIEQPASKALRFRYPCESRSTGAIPGASSTLENKTYPTIRILNYEGVVAIVASCVTKDPPYWPHPHYLVGRGNNQSIRTGVCAFRVHITRESNEYEFKNLGIQCVKRRDIVESLRKRQDLLIDPFKTGYSHMKSTQNIDMNAVRLCFQVLLPTEEGKYRNALEPVISNIVYDKKAASELHITKISVCSGTVRGGTQVILLCEKLPREDVSVVFYLENDQGEILWEDKAIIEYIHKQVAIVFTTPPFCDPNTSEHVSVLFQLRKKAEDREQSNSVHFEYIPEPDIQLKRKRLTSMLQMYDNNHILLKKRYDPST